MWIKAVNILGNQLRLRIVSKVSDSDEFFFDNLKVE